MYIQYIVFIIPFDYRKYSSIETHMEPIPVLCHQIFHSTHFLLFLIKLVTTPCGHVKMGIVLQLPMSTLRYGTMQRVAVPPMKKAALGTPNRFWNIFKFVKTQKTPTHF